MDADSSREAFGTAQAEKRKGDSLGPGRLVAPASRPRCARTASPSFSLDSSALERYGEDLNSTLCLMLGEGFSLESASR